MDRATIRYSLAVAVILTGVTTAVSAMAEGGQYQPPAQPVDPNVRLPGVIQLEQYLIKQGVTGLNKVKSQPAPPQGARPPQPAQPPQPEPAALPAQPLPQPPQAEPAALTPSQPVAVPRAERQRRETRETEETREAITAPAEQPMIPIATPEFSEEPVAAEGMPVDDASTRYAPPVRPPWWERLLASREFLYAAIFCLIVVPVGALAGSAILGRRREERDLALYD